MFKDLQDDLMPTSMKYPQVLRATASFHIQYTWLPMVLYGIVGYCKVL